MLATKRSNFTEEICEQELEEADEIIKEDDTWKDVGLVLKLKAQVSSQQKELQVVRVRNDESERTIRQVTAENEQLSKLTQEMQT